MRRRELGSGKSPRMSRVLDLVEPGLFTLNLGSGETSLGDVNGDIDRGGRPEVVLDATCLPFRTEAFGQVVFADVIEHLPEGTEPECLTEILRVLEPGGRLVVSTPNDRLLFKWLDPAHLLAGHRHYRVARLERLAQQAGLRPQRVFTAGGLYACLDNFFVMGTRFSKQVRRSHLARRVQREYTGSSRAGYTIFMVCVKP